MRVSMLLVVACLCAGTAFAKYQPSVVEGRRVTNPTVGYKGFTMMFPSGFRRFQPVEDRSLEATTYGQLTWREAADFDSAAGYQTQEIVVFSAHNRGIAFGVTFTDWDFSRITPRERDRMLRWQVKHARMPPEDEVTREVGTVGTNPVGKITRIIKVGDARIVNFIYIVFGRLNEQFAFNGVCAFESRGQLAAEMDVVAASLKIHE